ncbi:uncharacterized protein PG986_011266 [Apiospora aurea]|uniref:Uncharacterized protein n=1 Tax=Apiospora aurea TaxID=335848 RepID=A0ABR1Q4T1_9PEZI
MSSDETRFAQSVFAVREEDDGPDGAEFVDHSLKLDVVHKPSTSVLFRLSLGIPIAIDSTSTKVTIYLQITPDRIISLRNTPCDTSDTERTPPCLDRVRERLGGARFVTRLQFQLHPGLHAQLVVPTDFSLHEAPDSPARRLFASVSSLATASLFSLYMPHNVLPIKRSRSFEQAIRQFSTLTATQRHAFERMVNLRGLYRGKGGVVYTPKEQDVATTAAPDATASDATTESDAATVAFDTPSRYRDLPLPPPPEYEESPRDTAIGSTNSPEKPVSVDSVACDCAPPAYDDGEKQCRSTSKRLLHCGSEDVDLYPPKRMFRHPRKVQMSDKVSRLPPTTPSRLQLQLERQQRQIEQLQEDIKTLQKRNKELEGRQGELEENHGVLENRQGETEEAVESVLVHTGELDEECERLGKQVPDIGDEVEDWMKSSMGDTMKDYMADWLKENMSDSIQDYISQQVTAQIAEVKTKMRSALGD